MAIKTAADETAPRRKSLTSELSAGIAKGGQYGRDEPSDLEAACRRDLRHAKDNCDGILAR